MLRARRYVISGRVQGVGFRYFAQAAASRENVDGWARNLSDGRVEILAEGEEDALERFERQVRRGPSGARVDDIQTLDVPPSGRAGFGIY